MKDRFGNVPYALFSNQGRWIAMTREEYELAQATARVCRCGTCDCCRAVEYVRETTQTGGRHKAPEGECPFCDRERAAGNSFHPAHDPSPRCESGKLPHCSCDLCF